MKRQLLMVGLLGWATYGDASATLLENTPRDGGHARALGVLSEASGFSRPGGPPIKCGLPLLAYAYRHRAEISPGVFGALRMLDVRPSLQTSVLMGRFRIHFDTSGVNAPAMLDPSHTRRIAGTAREFVDSVGASAASTYQIEVDSLHFAPPSGDATFGGGPEFDIYVLELGRQYGYTAPDSNALPEGGRSSSFMVVDNDFIFLDDTLKRGIPALDVTVAHEFNHMIQIGAYGFWTTEVYYHEITSTWLEDVVYPSVNDYLQYVWSTEGQFANPGIPFTSNGLICYSRGIWGHFVAKRFGADLMRFSWEEARTVRPLRAIDNTLRVHSSSSFSAAFAEWALWNYFTGGRSESVQYYPEGGLYRQVTQVPCSYSGATRSVPDSVAPLAASYRQVLGASKPLTLIAANIDFQSALAWVDAGEAYSYILSPSALDDMFRATGAGVFVKLDAANPSHWWSWDVVNGIVGVPRFDEATPFPNPFIADGSSVVYIPSTSLRANLSIYSSSMILVYQADVQSSLRMGKRVFFWDGKTNETVAAQTGVYIYVLSLEDRTVTGKIALLRKR